MDMLLNPNIAYLAIVAAFMLGIFAVVTPGSGLLEIGALAAFVFAGWQMLNLEVNWWALVVLVLGVFPFLLALRKTRRMLFLGISIFALIVGSAFMFRGEVWYLPAVNPVLAVITSALAGGFVWFMTVKILEAEATTPTHDLGVLIGAVGAARTDVHHEGTVYVNGEDWSARSIEPIAHDSYVRVLGREGFVLDVEAVDEKEIPH
ncbi:MAG: hypothetical protein JXB38_11750 [Anaerolineales bacterium]|nr:hypothetical protein [Anaerolineales bacterium]